MTEITIGGQRYVPAETLTLARDATAIAQALGPDAQAAAAGLVTQVQTLAAGADLAAQRAAAFLRDLQQGITQDVAGFLTDLVTKGESVAETFQGLLQSIVQTLAQLTSQEIARQLVGGLFDAAHGQEAAAAATAAAGAVVGSGAVALQGSSVALGASGGVLLTAAAALQAAAVSLAAAGAAGGLFGGLSAIAGLALLPFGTGGRVPGLGTGDTVPAMLTPGEFVIQREAVSRLGLELLELLNAGAIGRRVVLADHLGRQRYAEGGLVSALQPGGATGTGAGVTRVQVELTLEEGIVAKHIKGREGQAAVVHVIGQNRNAVGAAQGRPR